MLWSEKGKPFKDATVTVNKKVVSKTGSDGIFHLDSMTPGIYKLSIEASKLIIQPYYYFSYKRPEVRINLGIHITE